METYTVEVVLVDHTGGRTIQHYLAFSDRVSALDATEAAFTAAAEFEPNSIEPIDYSEQGSTLTPVVAILTVFSVGAVLIAQSGLVNALMARFAQVVR